MKFRFNKYGAKAVIVDGIRFASKKEAARWHELKLQESAGYISALERQVRLPLIVNGSRITTYVADFVYCQSSSTVVEDSKGYQTPEFKIKWKLAQALFPDRRFILS